MNGYVQNMGWKLVFQKQWLSRKSIRAALFVLKIQMLAAVLQN